MDITTLIIIAVTSVISIIAFSNAKLFDRFKFSTYAIIELKQWDRLITSAFLHADWMHLIFNMLTLYFFAPYVSAYLGVFPLLLIYFGAILGGNLLSLSLSPRLYLHSSRYIGRSVRSTFRSHSIRSKHRHLHYVYPYSHSGVDIRHCLPCLLHLRNEERVGQYRACGTLGRGARRFYHCHCILPADTCI